jgi:hypothetical protein
MFENNPPAERYEQDLHGLITNVCRLHIWERCFWLGLVTTFCIGCHTVSGKGFMNVGDLLVGKLSTCT